jgi:hypothetical protein
MPQEELHALGLHEGKVLVDRLANTYNSVMLAVVEAAQNAIDADAEQIFIGIDQKMSRVVVLDDGYGIDTEKFKEALNSVGNGVKEKGSLGRFGLGMISPINKCREYRLVSQPRGTNVTRQWRFVGEKIRQQHKFDGVPTRLLPKMPDIPVPFKPLACGTKWRTMALLVDVTKDRTIGAADIEELSMHIRSKLGRGMRRKETTVRVVIRDETGKISQADVDPLKYTGAPLEEVVVTEDLAGKVAFHLYRAPKRGGMGVHILQAGDNSAISWREFYVQAMGSTWLKESVVKEAFDALSSGFFEGDIQVENIELDAERKKFVMNDALRASYIAIVQWFHEYGQKEYLNEKEARKEARYERLGEESLASLYALLDDDPSFSSITPQLTASSPKRDTKPKTGEKRRVVARHPANRPAVKRASRDPQSQGQSARTRLQFAYEMLPNSLNLWEFDSAAATLVFNIRHPLWAKCDETNGKHTSKHDRQIRHLQEWVALKVLQLLARHPETSDFEVERWSVDEEARLYVAAFILPRKNT